MKEIRLAKNKSTEENRQFWLHIEQVAKMIDGWPDWMKSLDPIGDAGARGEDLTQRLL